jgi:guanylate kinase
MIEQDQLIEWGTYGNNYYGTSTDAIRAIKFNGKVALMSPMNLDQAMSRLHTASIQAFVVFITVPESLNHGVDSENCEFEDDELLDIQGKEHERLVEQSREIFRKFNGQIDRVIVKRDFESCFNQLEGISFSLMNDQQWVPSRWIK